MSPKRTERRLAAIMFTDIVGYTAAMAESKEKGLRARERHRALVRPLVERYHGESIEAQDTGRFAPYMDLYRNMVEMRLTYDALQVLDFDTEQLDSVANGFGFFRGLVQAGKIAQGRFIARER